MATRDSNVYVVAVVFFCLQLIHSSQEFFVNGENATDLPEGQTPNIGTTEPWDLFHDHDNNSSIKIVSLYYPNKLGDFYTRYGGSKDKMIEDSCPDTMRIYTNNMNVTRTELKYSDGKSSPLIRTFWTEDGQSYMTDTEEPVHEWIVQRLRKKLGDWDGQSYSFIVKSISSGLGSAVKQCKQEFRENLWNCPVTADTIIPKTRQTTVTREVAYLQAISAAGTLYSLTRGCDMADSALCNCHEKGTYSEISGVHWKWNGCGNSRSLKFGERISKMFHRTGRSDSNKSATAVKRRNEKTGYKAVQEDFQVWCKCHGSTNNPCLFKTCWKSLRNFRRIAAELKEKYVNYAERMKTIKESNKWQRRRRMKSNPLVYLDFSPSYCEPDVATGLRGGKGRECKNLEAISYEDFTSSCDYMCGRCSLQPVTRVVEETETCDCNFHWCCHVDCQLCTRNVTKHFCE